MKNNNYCYIYKLTIAADLTVVELKSILRGKNIATTGNRAKLVLRLQQQNPDGSWIEECKEGGGGRLISVDLVRNKASQNMIKQQAQTKAQGDKKISK